MIPGPDRDSLPVIGIPRGFYSYRYGTLWSTFFSELGFRVVDSGPTDAAVFDRAAHVFEKDLCLPAKLYLAHVESLLQRSDVQFIPQIERLYDGLWSCPKIIAITDLAEVSFGDRLQRITPTVDLRSTAETPQTVAAAARVVGGQFGFSEHQVARALRRAVVAQSAWERRLRDRGRRRRRDLTVGIIGHPYVVWDARLNLDLLDKLDRAGIGWQVPDHLPQRTLHQAFRELAIDATTYWISDFELLGAWRAFTADEGVHGIIYLNTFGCAIDSVIEEYIQTLNRQQRVPFIKFVLDEHTPAATFNTRLAAFLDLLAVSRGRTELIDEDRLSG